MADDREMSDLPPVYEWHLAEWAKLVSRQERLPHAILFHGPLGSGKRSFAEAFCMRLLCEQPLASGHACGQCASCNWFLQASHPDFRRVLPPAEMQTGDETEPNKRTGLWISVEMIRELEGFVQLTSHRNGLKVVLLPMADRLNVASANALLKTLEEPPPGVVFVLVCEQLAKLLPTIRSRCQKVALPPPDHIQASAWLAEQQVKEPDWLALAGGMPLEVMRYQSLDEMKHLTSVIEWLVNPTQAGRDPVKMSTEWSKIPLGLLHAWLSKWHYDLIRGCAGNAPRYFARQHQEIFRLTEHLASQPLFELADQLAKDKRILNHPLNQKLVIENWLIGYHGMIARVQARMKTTAA